MMLEVKAFGLGVSFADLSTSLARPTSIHSLISEPTKSSAEPCLLDCMCLMAVGLVDLQDRTIL